MLRRSVLLLAAAITFGLVDAALWQRPGSFWVANMSSGYLILAFVAGAVLSRRNAITGAVAGGTAVLVALVAFYASLVDAQLFTGTTASHSFVRYAVPGLVCGPGLGWLGHRWGSRRSWYAPMAIAAAMSLEPAAWRHHLGFQPGGSAQWQVESALGLGLVVVVVFATLRRHRHP